MTTEAQANQALATRAAECARWTKALAPAARKPQTVREALGETRTRARANARYRTRALVFVCLPVCVAFLARVMAVIS